MTFFKPLAAILLFSILVFGCTQQTNNITGEGLSAVTTITAQEEPNFLVQSETQVQPTSVAGIFVIVIEDDFENWESTNTYLLKTQNRKIYKLTFKNEPQLRSGLEATVTGEIIDDQIIVSDYKQDAQEVSDNFDIGEQKLAIILADYEDDPISEEERQIYIEEIRREIFSMDNRKSFSRYINEISYGKAWVTGDIFGFYTLECTPDNFSQAVDAADPDIYFPDYKRVLLISISTHCGEASSQLNESIQYTDDGASKLSFSQADTYYHGDILAELFHEMLHGYGLGHSNGWDCGDESVYTGENSHCRNIGYGDRLYSPMGSVLPYFWEKVVPELHASERDILGWMDPSEILTVKIGSTYKIKPLELFSNTVKALKIPANEHIYYVEFRRFLGFDKDFTKLVDTGDLGADVFDGAMINFTSNSPYRNESYLIDTTPVGQEWNEDVKHVVLREGSEFYDPVNNIRILTSSLSDDELTLKVSTGKDLNRGNDGNSVEPNELTKLCLIPKFDLNKTSQFVYLNSRTDQYEFNNFDTNLLIPDSSQKCYFYQYKGQEPVLIYPKQQMKVQSDAFFDYQGTIQDLVSTINGNEYRYSDQFTVTIPTDLNFNRGDIAVMPFMGGRYQLLEINKDSNQGIASIKLKNLAKPSEVFLVVHQKGFPYDSNQFGNYKWIAEINQSGGNTLNGIQLINQEEQWNGRNGRNPALYGTDNLHGRQPNSADFLNGTNHPKEDFTKLWFNGFESKPKTNITIGDTRLLFEDVNDFSRHNLAFYYQLDARTNNSSFSFDGNKIVYYKFDNNANIFSYRYDLDANWNNISYVDGNVTSRFPIIGNASQTYYYRLFVDRQEADGYVILDRTSSNNILWTKYGKIIEFLGTDINEDGRIDWQYYAPNHSDFGGGVSNVYWIAQFKVKESPSRHSSEIFEIIDTNPSSGNPPSFPNTQLSYYDSDLNYSNSFGVKWRVSNEQPYGLPKAFTDYGTRIDLDLDSNRDYPKALIHIIPESDARVSMRIDVKER